MQHNINAFELPMLKSIENYPRLKYIPIYHLPTNTCLYNVYMYNYNIVMFVHKSIFVPFFHTAMYSIFVFVIILLLIILLFYPWCRYRWWCDSVLFMLCRNIYGIFVACTHILMILYTCMKVLYPIRNSSR